MMEDFLTSDVAIYAAILVLAISVGVMVDMENRLSRVAFAAVTLVVASMYFMVGLDAPFVIPIFLVVANGVAFGKSLYAYRDSPLLDGESPVRKVAISIAHPSRVREAALDHRRTPST